MTPDQQVIEELRQENKRLRKALEDVIGISAEWASRIASAALALSGRE